MFEVMLPRIGEYKKETILAPLYMMGEVLLEVIIPTVMAALIDKMYTEDMTVVLGYGAVLIVLALLSLFCGAKSARAAATASTGFAKNLRRDLFYKVQDFSFGDIDKFSSSSLVTRLTNDVSHLQMAFQMLIRMAVRSPLMVIFAVVMALRINARMAMIFFALIPILIVGLILIFNVSHPIFRRIFKKYDALNNSVQENVAGIRVVKSFVREDYEIEKFQNASEDVRSNFVRAERIIALNSPLMSTCMYTSMLLIAFLGSRVIVNSGATELTTGQLSSLTSYGVQILTSLMMLSMVFMQIIFATEAVNRIVEVLNYESTLTSPENGIKEVKDGSIRFENVTFRYGGANKNAALSDIDLDIKSGETVGIIGGTGSSKTTLIQLIPRLYDVSEGRVMVGDVDVRDYDLVSLRDEVAVVLQKNILFTGTIKDNLRWGNKDATDEEIIRVCKLAQADDFIQQMPDKYDTMLSQGGTNVSGGQKQRLCIARALLKKPKILILDDSTSAVDTRTDALIRKAFDNEIPDTTKIIIAQRVASVEHADKILVMDGGKIVEQGDHETLMKLGGIYKEIYDSQTKMKESE
ncbi:MAG: ABC transporter ATP-binding protein [Erysipelotrichaceae bacterium]|nr:ABC transporter ATP-binding protein [Erysipelotrichaceae bacterium]